MEWKTEDMTGQFDSADITGNKAVAALSYLGALVLVPAFGAKGSKFARFHANQGLALLVSGVAYHISASILSAVFLGISWRLYPLIKAVRLFGLVFPAFAVLGIVNAVSGKAKELPAIGKLKLLR